MDGYAKQTQADVSMIEPGVSMIKSDASAIEHRAFARAGLLGNPSDGFGGRTISFSIGQYFARVILQPSQQLEIVPQAADLNRFASMEDLASRVSQHGYYGAIRLLKGAIKRFYEYTRTTSPSTNLNRNFKLSYESSIPRAVGMAGSSAIIVATLRSLEEFYAAPVEPLVFPSLVMSVEVDELGIPAGLQDRVIQSCQGLVSMDFSAESSGEIHGMKHGSYRTLAESDLFSRLITSSMS